jgi:hypothetical protein
VLPARLNVRYAPIVAFFHGSEVNEIGREVPRVIYRGPAMLAPIVDASGIFRGVHITWIDLAQPNGKAVILDPDDDGARLKPKKIRGSMGGYVIRLAGPAAAPISPSQGSPDEAQQKVVGFTVHAGEGIETVLSVYAALSLAGRDVSGDYFVSTIDLGNLAGRAAESVRHPTLKDKAGRTKRVPGPQPDLNDRGFWLPPGASHVVLLGDGDSDPFETQCALRRASLRVQMPVGE